MFEAQSLDNSGEHNIGVIIMSYVELAFHCHNDGCPALVYAPQHQAIISGGKKGEVYIFDVRQRQLRQTFQAHDSAIRCMALDPAEECFVTGSADGDVKVGQCAETENAPYDLAMTYFGIM